MDNVRLARSWLYLSGVILIVVGILGFFSNPLVGPDGFVATDNPHNIVHILIGVWGLMAARSEVNAINFCKIAGVVYLVLGALGFVQPDGFGLVPLGGNDVWLHLVLGAVLAYFGFVGVKRPVTA